MFSLDYFFNKVFNLYVFTHLSKFALKLTFLSSKTDISFVIYWNKSGLAFDKMAVPLAFWKIRKTVILKWLVPPPLMPPQRAPVNTRVCRLSNIRTTYIIWQRIKPMVYSILDIRTTF